MKATGKPTAATTDRQPKALFHFQVLRSQRILIRQAAANSGVSMSEFVRSRIDWEEIQRVAFSSEKKPTGVG